MTDSEQRIIGRLEAEIEAMKEQNRQILADLREVRETLATAKGGWRTLLAVAGIAGTVGALAAKFAPFFGVLPK